MFGGHFWYFNGNPKETNHFGKLFGSFENHATHTWDLGGTPLRLRNGWPTPVASSSPPAAPPGTPRSSPSASVPPVRRRNYSSPRKKWATSKGPFETNPQNAHLYRDTPMLGSPRLGNGALFRVCVVCSWYPDWHWF